ncbi:MAG: YraN family protein [Alphaproteobacteria bacterium]|nr:YraN family protein [Alphaproteobacteria bacterium]
MNFTGKRKSEFIGRMAERFAIVFMLFKGYRCIALRYKCFAGEIDLIFKRGQTLIFCEVKYRADKDMLSHSVTAMQKKRIRHAAEFWLAQQKLPMRQGSPVRHNIRFDFIGLTLWQKPIHIKNAF